jgi:hypothetical protein
MGVRVRLAALLMAISLVTLGAPLSAAAHNFVVGNPNFPNCPLNVSTSCLQDNYIVTVNVTGGLGPKMEAATRSTWDGSYNTTDLVRAYTTVVSADIYYTNTDSLPVGVVGRTICLTAGSGPRRCLRARVLYDGGNIVAANLHNNPTALKALACHETGHAIGLVHPQDAAGGYESANVGCMASPLNIEDSLVRTHNVEHINGHY